MKKGQIVNPVGYAKYLAEFICGKNGEFFTATEAIEAVAVKASGVPRRAIAYAVCSQLLNWSCRSVLLREKRDDGMWEYLGPTDCIVTYAPLGSVADAAWRVLLSTTTPLRRRDVCDAIDPGGGRLFSSEVCTVLRRWHHDGILIRDGWRGQYTYRLTDEARARGTRPPCVNDKKPHPVASDGNMAHLT